MLLFGRVEPSPYTPKFEASGRSITMRLPEVGSIQMISTSSTQTVGSLTELRGNGPAGS